MPLKYEYAWRNLFMTLKDTAASTGSIQDRLGEAAYCHLVKLQPSHLPEDLQSQLTEIMVALTNAKTGGPSGDLRTTTRSLSDEQAIELVGAISSLFNKVDIESRY